MKQYRGKKFHNKILVPFFHVVASFHFGGFISESLEVFCYFLNTISSQECGF